MNELSLFSGGGIGILAAKQAGIDTVAMCECDPVCCFALKNLWPEAHLFTDVKNVSITSLRKFMPIDIISGGFPCQDLSTAGRGEGIEGGRSGLWREMFRIIRQVRPTWLVIENVPAIKLRGVDRVIAPLERIGYTCWPLVVGAWAVGAPHKRDRMWLVGRIMDDTRSIEPNRLSGGERQAIPEIRNSMRDGELADTRHVRRCDSEHQSEIEQEERAEKHDGGDELGDSPEARWRTWNVIVQGNKNREMLAIRCKALKWPSRPGEPQHEWEAPRLVKFDVGQSVDGLAGRVRSRANKSMLRILGNGWQYQIPEMIYKWIVEQDRNLKGVE